MIRLRQPLTFAVASSIALTSLPVLAETVDGFDVVVFEANAATLPPLNTATHLTAVLNKPDTLQNPGAGIDGFSAMTDVKSVVWKTKPNLSQLGRTTGVATVTYNNGDTRDVTIPVYVVLDESGFEGLSQTVSSAIDEAKSAKAKIDATKKSVEGFEGELKSLRNTAATDEEVAALEKKIEEATSEIAATHAKMVNTLNVTKNKVDSYDIAVQDLLRDRKVQNDEFVRSFTARYDDVVGKYNTLNTLVTTISTTSKTALDTANKGLNQVALLRQANGKLESQIGTERLRIDAMEGSLENLRNSLTKVRSRVRDVEETNGLQDSAIESALIDITSLKLSLSFLTDNIESLDSRINGLEATDKAQAREIVKLKETSSQALHDAKKALGEVDIERKRIDAAVVDLNKLDKLLSVLDSRVNGHDVTIDRIGTELVGLVGTVDYIDNRAGILEEDVTRIYGDIADIENQAAYVGHRMSVAEIRLGVHDNKLADLRNESNDLIGRSDDINVKLGNIDTQINQIREEITRLEGHEVIELRRGDDNSLTLVKRNGETLKAPAATKYGLEQCVAQLGGGIAAVIPLLIGLSQVNTVLSLPGVTSQIEDFQKQLGIYDKNATRMIATYGPGAVAGLVGLSVLAAALIPGTCGETSLARATVESLKGNPNAVNPDVAQGYEMNGSSRFVKKS